MKNVKSIYRKNKGGKFVVVVVFFFLKKGGFRISKFESRGKSGQNGSWIGEVDMT